MDKQTLNMTATDGTPVHVVVPTDLPTNEQADLLRDLYKQHVKQGGSDGRCYAQVRPDIADLVAAAMEFMGAHIDDRIVNAQTGTVSLFSKGPKAHGY